MLADELLIKLVDLLWREIAEPAVRKRLNKRAHAKFVEGDPALTTLDARIQQIERARSSLMDATEAVRELQDLARANKAEVEAVVASLGKVKAERAAAEQELNSLKKLAEIDVEAFRKVAGVPTQLQMAKERFRERAYGFILGILASVVASAIWWGFTKLLPQLK